MRPCVKPSVSSSSNCAVNNLPNKLCVVGWFVVKNLEGIFFVNNRGGLSPVDRPLFTVPDCCKCRWLTLTAHFVSSIHTPYYDYFFLRYI